MRFEPEGCCWAKSQFFGVRPRPEAKMARGMWVRESSKEHFLLQNAIFIKFQVFAPKSHFALKKWFSAQKVIFGSKERFLRFWPKLTPFGILFFHCLVQSAKVSIFVMNFTKKYDLMSKSGFSVLTFTEFLILHKIHHFGHVVFLYRGRKKCVDTLPPFRQGAFWSPKRVLGLQNPILIQ